MGFRFRRSVRIAPGLRLNLSKSGPSLSVGGKGATFNISKKGTRATFGIPGTGISYQTAHKHAHRHSEAASPSLHLNSSPNIQPSLVHKGIARACSFGVIVLLVAGVAWFNSSPSSTTESVSIAPVGPAAADAPADGQTGTVTSGPTAAVSSPVAPTEAAPPRTVTVLRMANIRSGPSVKDAIVNRAKPGDELDIVGKDRGWVEIRQGTATAWIAASLVH
ncbi:DUF4236 domain-containing protein [Acidisoma cellulosilytica]|uniref:DUF4236 domain-containing protein n=1 Tax=Acidisoma cellulosilyticum TaxID=2802395 RepID=A0A964E6Q4_9PROT|nr:DUF4236 domain-containing protein [Acidisoma cellulosilyticum]MCB8883829.1 DUF4236 domain-containing protein [Acidisoma cellulosilyticum]